MGKLIITPSERKALAVATAIALVGGAYFLRSYFILIVFAAILGFMFNPVYLWLLKRWKSPGKASMITLLISLLAIIIPVVLVIAISIQQVQSLVNNFDPSSFTGLESSAINTINKALQNLGISYQIDNGAFVNSLYTSLQSFGQEFVASLPSLFSSFFSILSSSIIFLYVFLSLLKNQSTLVNVTRALNPLGDDISNMYMDRTAAMTKAMVRGQFIIAVAQGFASAVGLAIAGLPELFFFFFLTLSALSVIPLGAGIVTIPIGIIMILTGNVAGGALVILNHLIIVTNIDNILRPNLVPKEAKLDSALTLLSVFAGLHLFGFFGIVIGPVLMILIVTTVKVYLEVYENIYFDSKDSKSNNIINRTSKRFHSLIRRPKKV